MTPEQYLGYITQYARLKEGIAANDHMMQKLWEELGTTPPEAQEGIRNALHAALDARIDIYNELAVMDKRLSKESPLTP